MKALLCCVLLVQSFGGRSLGMGLDVLPEAFAFAARRKGLPLQMQFVSCSQTRCQWTLGEGVTLSADLAQEGLDISKLEAKVGLQKLPVQLSETRYKQACDVILALVVPDQERRREAAEAIAEGRQFSVAPLDVIDRSVRVYGTNATQSNNDGVMRCGAVAV